MYFMMLIIRIRIHMPAVRVAEFILIRAVP